MNPMTGMLLRQAFIAHSSGRLEEAESLYRALLSLDACCFDALHYLGVLLTDTGRLEEGIALIERGLSIAPRMPDALSNLGSALNAAGDLKGAAQRYEQALALAPEMPEAWNGLGNVHLANRSFEAALDCFERAVRIKPDFPEAHNNRGNALQGLLLFDMAIEAYERAVACRPAYAEAHNNRGFALVQMRRCDEALESYDRALAVDPSYARAGLNKGLCLLLQGRYAEAWPLYELRWADQQQRSRRNYPQPLWAGRPLEGRRILLYAEQGLGDSLQFCRYVPLVQRAGGEVLLEMPAGLVRLMRSLDGVSLVFPDDEHPPSFDEHCPLASLPGIFGTTLETIPFASGYLSAEIELAQHWARKLELGGNRPTLGVAWAGSLTDPKRALTLEALQAVLDPAVRVVVLQKDIATEDRRMLRERCPEWSVPSDDIDSMADTAAIIAGLDLVLSIDTSVAHLAGALGKPLWLILHAGSDWRWLSSRTDSPWYGSARLFRQYHHGDWTRLLDEEVRPALDAWVRAR